MSDTPRTDHAQWDSYVDVELARTLERELASAKAEIERLRGERDAAVTAEREAICQIVRWYCTSDKDARQIIEAIRARGDEMSRDEIIKMAHEAGAYHPAWDNRDEVWTLTQEELERIVRAAEQAEREACARVCDSVSHDNPMTASECAAAIRARGKA